MAEFIYNGKSTKDFGLRITNNVTHELSSYDVEPAPPIPGRDGVLLMDNQRLRPVERAFPLRLNEDVYASTTEISDWLGAKGWNDLELSWDDEFIYRATVINTIAIEEVLRQLGKLQVVFLMHPIKYFRDGLNSRSIANESTITNRGNVEANPLIQLSGYGDTVIAINGRRTVLENIQGSITLDMQNKLVYRGNLPEWDKVVREDGAVFPYLDVGENDISWTGDFTMNLTTNEGVKV